MVWGRVLPERSRGRGGATLTRRACRGVLAGGGMVVLHSLALCELCSSSAARAARWWRCAGRRAAQRAQSDGMGRAVTSGTASIPARGARGGKARVQHEGAAGSRERRKEKEGEKEKRKKKKGKRRRKEKEERGGRERARVGETRGGDCGAGRARALIGRHTARCAEQGRTGRRDGNWYWCRDGGSPGKVSGD